MATILLAKYFQNNTTKRRISNLDREVFGKKVGLFASLFGCWHDEVTRPFMQGKSAYRACLRCGARKPFNPQTLITEEKFYYPPIVKKMRIE